eukprot:g1613.t1
MTTPFAPVHHPRPLQYYQGNPAFPVQHIPPQPHQQQGVNNYMMPSNRQQVPLLVQVGIPLPLPVSPIVPQSRLQQNAPQKQTHQQGLRGGAFRSTPMKRLVNKYHDAKKQREEAEKQQKEEAEKMKKMEKDLEELNKVNNANMDLHTFRTKGSNNPESLFFFDQRDSNGQLALKTLKSEK